MTPPLLLRKPRDVRESPMLQSVQLLFLIIAHVKVVPEKSVSMDDSESKHQRKQNWMHTLSPLITSVSQRAITSVKAALISVAKSLCLNK